VELFAFAKSLFVTNAGDGSLLAFDPPAEHAKAQSGLQRPVPRVSEGNISPSRHFPDAFKGPAGLYLDRPSDTLYVANAGQNSISIYQNISTLTPPQVASCVISGSRTQLNQPFGLAYDATHSRLYVANRDGNTVIAFNGDCPSGALKGNIAPASLLRLAGDDKPVQLDLPRAVAVDASRDILYISNMGSDSILVYDEASTALGGAPSDCSTDFTPCNQAPDRNILPHSGADNTSKLELPYGIFVDSANDRLYVANTGLNTPGIFIYEHASTRDQGAVPERVVISRIAQLPETCSPAGSPPPALPLPPECSLTQLTAPAGIDVDVAGERVFVINNNSPNNVNRSDTANVDSPSLIVFNGVITACPVGTPCLLSPDRRIGGNVFSQVGTTLSAPLGVAIDPAREITYVANAGGDNLLAFSFTGDLFPIRQNASLDLAVDKTLLEEPSSFFYDSDLDRLYVVNYGKWVKTTQSTGPNIFLPYTIPDTGGKKFNEGAILTQASTGASGTIAMDVKGPKTLSNLLTGNLILTNVTNTFTSCPPPNPGEPSCIGNPADAITDSQGGNAAPGTPRKLLFQSPIHPVVVHDQVSAISFSNSKPNWGFESGANFNLLRGFYIDKTRGYLLTLQSSHPTTPSAAPRLAVYCVPLADGSFNAACSASPGLQWSSLPVNQALAPQSNPLPPDGLTVFSTPTVFKTFQDGLGAANLTSMAVDEVSGEVYILDQVSKKIFAYNLDTLTGSTLDALSSRREFTSASFNNPQGLAIDSQRNRLYVTDVGALSVFTFDNASTINGPVGTPSANVAPDRTTTTTILTAPPGGEPLTEPISPFVDEARDQLYVLDAHSNAVFVYDSASTMNGDTAPGGLIFGLNTLLDFMPPLQIPQLTGALVLAKQKGDQMLYVGQPKSHLCDLVDPLACPPGEILVYGVQGRVAPSKVFLGGGGGFSLPSGVAMDGTRKILYVTNESSNVLSVLKDADTLDANSTAASKTDLKGLQLNRPSGLALDAKQNLLFVSNSASNQILLFKDPDKLKSDTPPNQILTHAQLSDPQGLAVDAEAARLYVASRGSNSVLIYRIDGGVAVLETTLRGSGSQLSQPASLALDPGRDLLYVLNQGTKEVLVFEGASSLSGTAAPTRHITGSDAEGLHNVLTAPSAIAVDFENDLLYLSDAVSNAVYIVLDASSAEGQDFDKTLSGDKTGLFSPVALAVDPSAP